MSNTELAISHLVFADDVLLFAKVKVSQARVINQVLENFCNISSMEKSVIFVSKGVSMVKRDKIKQVLNTRFTNHIDKYLDFKIYRGVLQKMTLMVFLGE